MFTQKGTGFQNSAFMMETTVCMPVEDFYTALIASTCHVPTVFCYTPSECTARWFHIAFGESRQNSPELLVLSPHSPQPQVRHLHLLALEQVGRSILQGDGAAFHDVAAVGDAKGHVGVLLHEEDGGVALAVDAADGLEDELHEHRGQAQVY